MILYSIKQNIFLFFFIFSNFLKEKGFPLQTDEIRELFIAVDNDGDVTSLNKEGTFYYIYYTLLRLLKR